MGCQAVDNNPDEAENLVTQGFWFGEIILVDNDEAGLQPVLPGGGLEVPERVGSALVDQVLPQDGVGRLQVGRIPRGERTFLQHKHNVGDEEVADAKVVVKNLRQVGKEGGE